MNLVLKVMVCFVKWALLLNTVICQAPFADLFKSDVPVYMKQDFTFTYFDDGNCQVIGDIQNLLSKDNFVVGWCEDKK